jgi:hypothetical protein
MCLHLEGFTGHIVHSGTSRVQKIDALFYMFEWDSYRFDKSAPGHITPNLCFASDGICGSDSAFQCVWCMKHQRTIFISVSGGPRAVFRKKKHRDMLC